MIHAPTIGLFHDRLRPEERLLATALERSGAHVERVYVPAWSWSAEGAAGTEGAATTTHAFDLALVRTLSHVRSVTVARLLEASGMVVVNASAVIETCGDKASTTAALTSACVPQPRTIVAFSREQALEAATVLGWPVVVKPVVGSWGRMVARLSDVDALDAVLEHKLHLGGSGHQTIYVQEHVDKPGRDLRAFVVGQEVVAAIARVGSDWRTNTARGATVEGVRVTSELRDVALAAAAAVGGGILAVDLLESDRGLLVSEVNHGLEFRNSSEPTGVDIAGAIAAYLVRTARAVRSRYETVPAA